VTLRIILISIILLSFQIQTQANDPLLEQLLEAADQRNVNSPTFSRVLAGNNKQYQKQALLALGRIGGHPATIKISPFLYSKDEDLRSMAAFSLGISTDIGAHKLLKMRLNTETSPGVISRLLIAIGNVGEPKDAIASILPFLNNPQDKVVAAACDALTLAWTFNRDRVSVPNSSQVYRLLALSKTNQIIAEHCLFTLSRLSREPALFDLKLLATLAETVTEVEAKLLLIRIMGAMNNMQFLNDFTKTLKSSPSSRLKAEAASAIAALFSDEKNTQHLEAIKLASLDPSSHVKVNLINSLKLKKEFTQLTEVVIELSKDKSAWVRHQAMTALFAIQAEKMHKQFLSLVGAKSFESQQAALNILRLYKLEDHNKHLQLLAKSRHKGIKSIASRLLNNEDADAEEEVPASKTIKGKVAYALAAKRMNIKTSRGNIIIQLSTSAAFTSANFYQLAKAGFYDGLIFHRVVPNFVVQGGDPESTGQGGPGFSIREELSLQNHSRGSLGIATSGKDTGGSQFFFNNSNNIHLNNNYTVFAHILEGIEIIDRFEVGDKIISITEL